MADSTETMIQHTGTSSDVVAEKGESSIEVVWNVQNTVLLITGGGFILAGILLVVRGRTKDGKNQGESS